MFHFKALLWESIILLLPHPSCKAYPIAILLHDHCGIYAPPPTPHTHSILVMAIGLTASFCMHHYEKGRYVVEGEPLDSRGMATGRERLDKVLCTL